MQTRLRSTGQRWTLRHHRRGLTSSVARLVDGVQIMKSNHQGMARCKRAHIRIGKEASVYIFDIQGWMDVGYIIHYRINPIFPICMCKLQKTHAVYVNYRKTPNY